MRISARGNMETARKLYAKLIKIDFKKKKNVKVTHTG